MRSCSYRLLLLLGGYMGWLVAMLSTFSRTLEALPTSGGSPALEAPGVPATVGLTLYRNGKGLFVDVNNTALDLETDTITPAMPLRFRVNLPKELRGQKLRVRVLAPEDAPGVEFVQKGSQRLEVELGAVPVFASVQMEGTRCASEVNEPAKQKINMTRTEPAVQPR